MSFSASRFPLTSLFQRDGSSDALSEEEIKAWAPIVGGGALLLYGLARGGLIGLTLAGAGGVLLYRGLVPRPTMMRTGAATTINKTPEELFNYWRNLENLPHVMANLESVTETGDRRSHWVAHTVGGATVEWDAQIVDMEPNHYIAWQSAEGSEIQTSGIIRFEPAPGGRGTEVHLTLEYSLPLGTVGAVDAAMMGMEPSQQAREDLQRFKQIMETGQIITTEGQPAGERGRAPDVEKVAGVINNVLEGVKILRTGGRPTQSRAGTRT